MENAQGFHTVRGYQLLEHKKGLLTSAMEDYLEMIYRNSLLEGYMRVNMLSELLNVSAPSVTRMVQKLSKLGLINYKRYGIIFLTEEGKELGSFLLSRHQEIEKFLHNIGVATENLLVETELIEHNVSVNTLKRLELLNGFFDRNPEIKKKLLEFI